MLKRIFVLFVVLSLFLSSPVLAKKVKEVEAEATHILVGKVKNVESYYGVNDWGDVLILSQVEAKVERKVKGKMEDSVSFVVEGGTVGDMTLKVSEYPLFTEGEKVKLYLKKINYFFHFVKSEKLETARARGGKPDKKPKGGGDKCCKTFAHWPDSDLNVLYYVNTKNNDINNRNCVKDDIIDGAAAWNSASSINLTFDGTIGATEVNQNFINEIFFRDKTSGGTIAVTYTWYYRKGRRIVEFDMVFYDGAWKFSSLTCNNSCSEGFFVQTIAAHEFGHAIGIDHNRCKTSIMYPYADFCAENTALSDDDIACVSNLYK